MCALDRITSTLIVFEGRTGRAGREGKATTFFTDEDAPFLKSYVAVS